MRKAPSDDRSQDDLGWLGFGFLLLVLAAIFSRGYDGTLDMIERALFFPLFR